MEFTQNDQMKSVKPPFGYFGAKQKISSKIVEMMPTHNAWVEAFCGSAAITLAKKPAPIEVINDKDGEIVNVFEQLRTNIRELCEAITLTPYARDEFLKAKERNPKLSNIERARRFLVSSMMSVNGTQNSHCGFSYSSSYARNNTEARVSRWNKLPERLALVAERLRRIRIENRDARELIPMFAKRPATLMYLDPPYFVKRNFGYTIDAKDESFHCEILELCCKSNCMIMISGYDTPLYNEMLTCKKGWKRHVIETHTRDTSGKDYARSEIIWLNQQFDNAIKFGTIPIKLTEKELTQKKLNPER